MSNRTPTKEKEYRDNEYRKKQTLDDRQARPVDAMLKKEEDSDLCHACGEKVGKFRNSLSRREYSLSGLCQECQDEFFDGGNE